MERRSKSMASGLFYLWETESFSPLESQTKNTVSLASLLRTRIDDNNRSTSARIMSPAPRRTRAVTMACARHFRADLVAPKFSLQRSLLAAFGPTLPSCRSEERRVG